jgi:O-acetyl-ADP-ribose deacetylase (regulator of RNase III)
MKQIKYVKGNALEPVGEGKKVIIHICNNYGAWGAGFVLAISKKWDLPEREYKSLGKAKQKLGNVQFVMVENDIIIANMIAQDGLQMKEFDLPPVHYTALDICLQKVYRLAHSMNASVHLPRIGVGLGRGRWDVIEFLLNDNLVKKDVDVVVYDLN